jgi:hypothetical protein
LGQEKIADRKPPPALRHHGRCVPRRFTTTRFMRSIVLIGFTSTIHPNSALSTAGKSSVKSLNLL